MGHSHGTRHTNGVLYCFGTAQQVWRVSSAHAVQQLSSAQHLMANLGCAITHADAGGRHEFDIENRQGNAWPESWYEGLSDAQRAVLEPPYHPRLDRPVLGDDGELTPSSTAILEAKGWRGLGNNGATPTRKPKL